MRNTFGNNITVTLFGESHGREIGIVADGLTPGMDVNEDFIKKQLSLRRPKGNISTGRIEEDNFRIISGVLNNKTTGAPLTIIIENNNIKSDDYKEMKTLARPSHADYTANEKYSGFNDLNGGGHFSGRLTAPIVALGAIIIDALKKKNIYIGTHIKKCNEISDREFEDYLTDIETLNNKDFAVLDLEKEQLMKDLITKTKNDGDSIGGILETVILGMPIGIGEPWFDSLESMYSHGLFSIPAIKGVEFGLGFEFCNRLGSNANDCFYNENGEIKTFTNNSGGINGGISNGMPIIIRSVVKPTPTIFKEQKTINLKTGENTTIMPKGRHDPFIAHRARVVADSIVAITTADMLATQYKLMND